MSHTPTETNTLLLADTNLLDTIIVTTEDNSCYTMDVVKKQAGYTMDAVQKQVTGSEVATFVMIATPSGPQMFHATKIEKGKPLTLTNISTGNLEKTPSEVATIEIQPWV